MFSGIKYIHTVVWQTSPITSSMLYPSNTNSSFPPPAFPGNHCTTLGFYAFDHPQFNSVYSLRHVWLLATPWTAACQASLSITNSQNLLTLMSIDSVTPSNHFILCRPLLLLSWIFPSIRVFFQWVSSLHQLAKVLEFQLQHLSFQWTPGTDLL